MVERVINMWKLAHPKQDDKNSPHGNLTRKSSSPDSSGFGRTLSKKSLDMAMRHMETAHEKSRKYKENLSLNGLRLLVQMETITGSVKKHTLVEVMQMMFDYSPIPTVHSLTNKFLVQLLNS